MGQDGPVVVKLDIRRSSQGNLEGDIAGGQDKAEREGHPLGDGSVYFGGRKAGGWICWDGDR